MYSGRITEPCSHNEQYIVICISSSDCLSASIFTSDAKVGLITAAHVCLCFYFY